MLKYMNKHGTYTKHSQHVNDSKNLSTPSIQKKRDNECIYLQVCSQNENVWYDYLTHQSRANFCRYYQSNQKIYWIQVYSTLDLTMATETTSFLVSQVISRFYRKNYSAKIDIKSKRAKNNNNKIKEIMEQQK